jgi:hypothetical protein
MWVAEHETESSLMNSMTFLYFSAYTSFGEDACEEKWGKNDLNNLKNVLQPLDNEENSRMTQLSIQLTLA